MVFNDDNVTQRRQARTVGFLEKLERAQVERAPDFHAGGIMDWSPAERGNELGGEYGELIAEVLTLGKHIGAVQNDLKKLLRFDKRHQLRDSDPPTAMVNDLRAQRDAIVARIRSELGDVFICASLVAIVLGISTEDAIRDKFNATSDKIGSAVKL